MQLTDYQAKYYAFRCEWGYDDYSLKVENLPQGPPALGQQSLFGAEGLG